MIDEAMLITILAHQTFSLAAITTFALIAIIQCTKKKDSTGAVPPGQPPPAPAPLPPMDEQKTQSLMDEGEGEKKKVEEKKEVVEKVESKKESSKEKSSKKDSKVEEPKKSKKEEIAPVGFRWTHRITE
ncbi:hypothetical protein X798_07761 [Onchocerca flexuosa]|uniref:Uncharacterized protein n=1 Tax=Onchocerca flexuosa TaxID=387005 RepID=A0A238BL56_9BILA|nr:hypothetical protein X798_07761 [Onchocerca flexuosa]